MNNNPLYRKTEAILYNYNKVKAQIKNIELDIENIKNDFNGPGAIGYEERTQSTNSFNSSVENEVVARENEINQLLRYQKQKEIELLKVDNAIGSLTEREKLIIEMRYFKKYNNKMIAAKLDLTEEYICNIKRNAVNQVLDLLF
ncbi:MAG: sigma factor-like helix-turn-helix DNA-binding protein [Clostridium sp.]|uniref:sigma factor-like helix-turn-helix DNA-binding protein n=1 Tax=Clostridium sp. TaxID=1506 RepID=UPI002913DA8E|nr:sigma factor-like helix-turn-helix DNA-binding protein [Clostridium sp.]MDU5110303.1 sigma factor-like helix-turn-helix DNA-binding protein [Clostridium sp.]